MRSAAQLLREEAFDRWLDERFGMKGVASISGRETSAGWDDEVEAMSKMAELVSEHVSGPVSTETHEASGAQLFRGSSLLRIAAVLLLLAGLGVGLGLAASRSGRTQDVPAGGFTTAAMPSALYNKLETQAGTAANPYPSTPVFWVKTTARAVDNALLSYHVVSQANLPARTVEWVGQVTSRFYGDPEHKTNIYGTILDVWTPVRLHRQPPAGGGGATGLAPVPNSVLEQLGTVHLQFLRPPPTPPALPGPVEKAMATKWAALYGDKPPSLPVLWVKTTVGAIGIATDRALGLPSSPANLALWVIESRDIRSSLPPTTPETDWYVTTAGASSRWQFKGGHGLPRKDRRIGDLSSLGDTQRIWLNGGVPRTLSPEAKQIVTGVLPTEYAGSMSTLLVQWVGTTAARLRSDVPWTPIAATVPGPTPVWIVQASDAKAQGGFSDQWFMSWGDNPSSASAPNSWISSGGSGMFGITHLGQLGTVHEVNVSTLTH